ncbi:MAG TPA: hypothetical protein VME46_10190 [Acidimicrobiales bacterium]|nr:hypothetical protein [Acidimicrobiales bacterium]
MDASPPPVTSALSAAAHKVLAAGSALRRVPQAVARASTTSRGGRTPSAGGAGPAWLPGLQPSWAVRHPVPGELAGSVTVGRGGPGWARRNALPHRPARTGVAATGGTASPAPSAPSMQSGAAQPGLARPTFIRAALAQAHDRDPRRPMTAPSSRPPQRAPGTGRASPARAVPPPREHPGGSATPPGPAAPMPLPGPGPTVKRMLTLRSATAKDGATWPRQRIPVGLAPAPWGRAEPAAAGATAERAGTGTRSGAGLLVRAAVRARLATWRDAAASRDGAAMYRRTEAPWTTPAQTGAGEPARRSAGRTAGAASGGPPGQRQTWKGEGTIVRHALALGPWQPESRQALRPVIAAPGPGVAHLKARRRELVEVGRRSTAQPHGKPDTPSAAGRPRPARAPAAPPPRGLASPPERALGHERADAVPQSRSPAPLRSARPAGAVLHRGAARREQTALPPLRGARGGADRTGFGSPGEPAGAGTAALPVSAPAVALVLGRLAVTRQAGLASGPGVTASSKKPASPPASGQQQNIANRRTGVLLGTEGKGPMSIPNGPLVMRWKSPTRPTSARPGSPLVGGNREAPSGTGAVPGAATTPPRSPQVNEDLDELMERVAARRFNDLERRGHLLAMEVF